MGEIETNPKTPGTRSYRVPTALHSTGGRLSPAKATKNGIARSRCRGTMRKNNSRRQTAVSFAARTGQASCARARRTSRQSAAQIIPPSEGQHSRETGLSLMVGRAARPSKHDSLPLFCRASKRLTCGESGSTILGTGSRTYR
jgi:hypothetical protein